MTEGLAVLRRLLQQWAHNLAIVKSVGAVSPCAAIWIFFSRAYCIVGPWDHFLSETLKITKETLLSPCISSENSCLFSETGFYLSQAALELTVADSDLELLILLPPHPEMVYVLRGWRNRCWWLCSTVIRILFLEMQLSTVLWSGQACWELASLKNRHCQLKVWSATEYFQIVFCSVHFLIYRLP